MDMNFLFYHVIHNKYLRNKIFQHIPLYVFENDTIKFYGSSRWALRNNKTNSSQILITDNKQNLYGSCWTKTPISLMNSFSISFNFEMNKYGGDGIGVCFLKKPYSVPSPTPNSISEYGNMGYNGFLNGIACCSFDVANPFKNIVSIQTNDNSGKLSNDSSYSLGSIEFKNQINDGNTHRIDIIYKRDFGSLSIFIDTKLILNNIEIPEFVKKIVDKEVYIGIVGSTSNIKHQKQTISNLKITKIL